MNTTLLDTSELKDKYFARLGRWDWLTNDTIHVVDPQRPRMITMDPWPQMIYLDALGQNTVKEYVYEVSGQYAKSQVPKMLANTILEELQGLVDEGLIALYDTPLNLELSLLNPMTKEGKITMKGAWKGFYTYNIPEEYQDEKTKKVDFTIVISEVSGKNFAGSVQDDLETGGTPGIGKIKGKYTDDELQFDKDMPISAIITEKREHITDTSKPHPTIVYKGTFSKSKQQVSGTWKFKKAKLVWRGIFPFWIRPMSGNFEMRKEEDLL